MNNNNNIKANTFESKTLDELAIQKKKNIKLITASSIIRNIVLVLILLFGNITTTSTVFGEKTVYKYSDFLNNSLDRIMYILFFILIATSFLVVLIASKKDDSSGIHNCNIILSVILLVYGCIFFMIGFIAACDMLNSYTDITFISMVWLVLQPVLHIVPLLGYLGIAQIKKAEQIKRQKQNKE